MSPYEVIVSAATQGPDLNYTAETNSAETTVSSTNFPTQYRLNKKRKAELHPCTGTEALYRP